MAKPKLFTNIGDVEAQRQSRHDRAKRIEVLVQNYLSGDEEADAADLALGLLENPEFMGWQDERIAQHVAMLIEQA